MEAKTINLDNNRLGGYYESNGKMVDDAGMPIKKVNGSLSFDPAVLIKLSTELEKNKTLEKIRCILIF